MSAITILYNIRFSIPVFGKHALSFKDLLLTKEAEQIDQFLYTIHQPMAKMRFCWKTKAFKNYCAGQHAKMKWMRA